MINRNLTYGDYTFVMTCCACPEQYNVFDKSGNQVAYVRLRWGVLRVDAPFCGGEIVYDLLYDDAMLGCFEDEDEREKQLTIIATKIAEYKGKMCALLKS